MARNLFWLIIAGILLLVGVQLFTPLHNLVESVDMTGFDDATRLVNQFFPFLIIFAIGYGAYLLGKKGD